MLNNKWIIVDKYPYHKKTGMLYDLLLVDCSHSSFNTDRVTIYSNKDVSIGTFVDYNLNRIEEQYRYSPTDTAVVEMATVFDTGGNEDLKRIAMFGDKTGCFDTFVDAKRINFPIRRGDIISTFTFEQQKTFVPSFKFMANLTTGHKSPDFEEIYNNCQGDFEDVVIVGIGAAGIGKKPSKKHLLIHSKKFGYVSKVVSSDDNLFITRAGDKLVVEKQPKWNAFEVLRNLTADNMRTAYILQRE